MAKYVDRDLKEQVLRAVRDGMKVSWAKAKFGVSDNVVCGWLRVQTDKKPGPCGPGLD
ncbi:hypothetical protein JW899_01090 [Candidatus Uhrbacteria bacterium]|nr:hypothetical protein [Candidatus Uhrbacteria bacterium]